MQQANICQALACTTFQTGEGYHNIEIVICLGCQVVGTAPVPRYPYSSFWNLGCQRFQKKKIVFSKSTITLSIHRIALIISSLNLPCKFAGHHHFQSLKYVPYRFVSKTAWFWLKPSILTSDIHSKF